MLEYTATTTNDADKVTATAAYPDDAEIAIVLGDSTTVTNGSNATWEDGSNTLTITVTAGTDELVYTVTVTKESSEEVPGT